MSDEEKEKEVEKIKQWLLQQWEDGLMDDLEVIEYFEDWIKARDK